MVGLCFKLDEWLNVHLIAGRYLIAGPGLIKSNFASLHAIQVGFENDGNLQWLGLLLFMLGL